MTILSLSLLEQRAHALTLVEVSTTVGVSIFGGLLLVSGIIFFIQSRAKKALKRLLEEKNIEVEHLKQKAKHAQQLIDEKDQTIDRQQAALLEKEKSLNKARKNATNARKELLLTNHRLQGLKRESQDRGERLKDVVQNLNRSDEELDRFVYKASHDLRAPIARIQGLANIARLEKNEPKIMLSYLNKMEKISFEMDNMLSKLLTINFINIDELNLQELDFKKVLENVVKDLEAKHLNSPVKIHTHLGKVDKFICDPKIVEIIIENLLENALIYHRDNLEPEEEPEVSLDIKTYRNNLRIIVQDNGTGIAKEYHDKAFQMFFKGTERSKGNGLGLYAVQRALAKVNGTITLESALNSYTKAVVRIPYDSHEEQPA